MEWPKTIIQLLGFLGGLAGILFGLTYSWREHLKAKNERHDREMRRDEEIAKQNTLTASQVADVLREIYEQKKELDKLKNIVHETNLLQDMEDKQVLESINRIETTIEKFEDTLQKLFHSFIPSNFLQHK